MLTVKRSKTPTSKQEKEVGISNLKFFMRQFAELVTQVGTSTKTTDKLEALVHYFSSEADEKDKIWVIALFSGRRPKRAVNTTQLASYAIELAGLPFLVV